MKTIENTQTAPPLQTIKAPDHPKPDYRDNAAGLRPGSEADECHQVPLRDETKAELTPGYALLTLAVKRNMGFII